MQLAKLGLSIVYAEATCIDTMLCNNEDGIAVAVEGIDAIEIEVYKEFKDDVVRVSGRGEVSGPSHSVKH